MMQIYNNAVQVNNVLNVSASSGVVVGRMLMPNIGTGNGVEFHLGVIDSGVNTGIIQFNYVGNNASGSGGNSLGFGLGGANNIFQVYSNSAKCNGPLTIINASGVGPTVNMFTPGLGNGGDVEFHVGISDNTLNCGVIQYNYVNQGAAGNTGNNVGIGMYGANNMIQVYSNGIKINGNLTKSSGSFDIPHPDPIKQKKKYRLRHCFVESNTRGDNLYRYTITTNNGEAEIQLPDYFQHLNENPQVFITAIDVFGFSKGLVDTELKKVHIAVSVDGTYNVLVIGTRKDKLAAEYFDLLGIEYIED
jgi:hypothetical protein